MKIACFLQTFNEMESGHLERFLTWNMPLFDYLAVYDDGSTDSTVDVVRSHADVLLEAQHNLFKLERSNKRRLLAFAQESLPDIDWFVWLDCDEVLYCDRAEIEAVLDDLTRNGFDGARLPHINLWRSDHFFRKDEYFDSLEPIRLWKNSRNLVFPDSVGLHGELSPDGMTTINRLSFPAVVHYGFASDELILRKYRMYEKSGQSGWLLERLISESGRDLQLLSSRRELLGARFEAPLDVPDPPPAESRLTWALKARSENSKDNHQPLVTVVCLIYCSVEWLEFVYGEMLRIARSLRQGDVEVLFVANDATPEVIDYLRTNGIPHVSVKTRLSADEWFINSVYRAYNLGVEHARGEYVYLINSDMAFDHNALPELLRHVHPKSFLVSRLVELGVLRTGEHGVEHDFGAEPSSFRRRHFERFAARISTSEEREGGLFMPLLVNREGFLGLGGFPAGNLLSEDLDDYLVTGTYSRVATEGQACIPGDRALFSRAESMGYRHSTLFSSIAYHFQAGERRSEGQRSKRVRSGIAIINDSIDGINGERVLWGELHQRLTQRGIESSAIGANGRFARLRFHLYARWIIRRESINPRVIFSNATFSYPFSRRSYRVTLRQDSVTSTWLRWMQRWVMASSDLVLANDPDFTAEQSRQHRKWVTVPLSDIWTTDSPELRPLDRGIFVGAFDDIKGWQSVRRFIAGHPEIEFDLVSKYPHDDPGSLESLPNVRTHRQLSQSDLRDLFDRSGFFLLGSPYETQCLAALEAASRNLPVLMPPTGLLGNLPEALQSRVGCFDSDLEVAWQLLNQRWKLGQLAPRQVVEEIKILGEGAWENWDEILQTALESSFIRDWRKSPLKDVLARLSSGLRLKFRQLIREVIRPVVNRMKWSR